jgi:transposase
MRVCGLRQTLRGRPPFAPAYVRYTHRLQAFVEALSGHASGILAWWKHRISNGRMEGINNKIKTILRQTYGLRDERFFTLKLYSLHHSRLTLLG